MAQYHFTPKHRWFLCSEERSKTDPNCAQEALTGEEALLNNPFIDECCAKMVSTFVPQHDKMVISLCSSTRPYIDSLKWKAFHKHFGSTCDLVICSNGGIIPIEYMNCFPFLEYDAHRGSSQWDQLYKDKMMERLDNFFKVHGKFYKKIIFAFLPTSRNAEAIMQNPDKVREWETSYGFSTALLPTADVYQRIQEEGSPGVNIMRYPQIAHQSLNEMAEFLGVTLFKPKTKRLF